MSIDLEMHMKEKRYTDIIEPASVKIYDKVYSFLLDEISSYSELTLDEQIQMSLLIPKTLFEELVIYTKKKHPEKKGLLTAFFPKK